MKARVCQLFEVRQNEFANFNLPCEGRLTVRFDLSDYKQLLIGQVKSDSSRAASAKLSNK